MGGGCGLEAEGHFCTEGRRGDGTPLHGSRVAHKSLLWLQRHGSLLYESYVPITGVDDGKTALAALPLGFFFDTWLCCTWRLPKEAGVSLFFFKDS